LTKQELIERVWERVHRDRRAEHGASLPRKTVQSLVEAVFDELAEYFTEERSAKGAAPKFTYPAFGTFTKRKRPERTGRNPRSGEAITIPASFTVAFAPGRDLKTALNRRK
jgi:DNA-binding protein HU-beta